VDDDVVAGDEGVAIDGGDGGGALREAGRGGLREAADGAPCCTEKEDG